MKNDGIWQLGELIEDFGLCGKGKKYYVRLI